MKNQIFMCAMCAVVAATAIALGLGGDHALAFEIPPVAPLPRMGLPVVQVQDQPNSLFRGVGVVTDIHPATGSLTINHEEIPGFMPPMEMLFRVDPRTLSDGVQPGDKVEFLVEGKTYTIRKLSVIERAK